MIEYLRNEVKMSKTLVLAEKPSVGRDIAQFYNAIKMLMVVLKEIIYCYMGFRVT